MLYAMNKSMSSRFFSILVVILLNSLLASTALAVGAVTNQAQSLTLRECVERALENNLEIKSQRINPSIGTWGVIGAQGEYDPVLSGAVNYQDASTPLGPEQAVSLKLSSLKQQQLNSSAG